MSRPLTSHRPFSLLALTLASLATISMGADETTAPATATSTSSTVAIATDTSPATSAGDAGKVERGRYLTVIAFCNDCHTPWHLTENGPEPDMSRMLSGHPEGEVVPPAPALDGYWGGAIGASNTAWAGPWGVSFTANLTPDPETGTGTWTEEEFIAAIRSGLHRGRGRQILPPMPWPFLSQATDDDLAAIYAYLQTIPPISNRVPDPVPPAVAH